MYERTSLILISTDGEVEVVPGRQSKMVLRETVARHFSSKATELLQVPSPAAVPGYLGRQTFIKPMKNQHFRPQALEATQDRPETVPRFPQDRPSR